jgi:CYTH domain-containing protein
MVDTFLNVEGVPSIMRIETTKEAQQIKIPPFVKMLREVTEEIEYETRTMADHDYLMSEKDRNAIEEQMGELK